MFNLKDGRSIAKINDGDKNTIVFISEDIPGVKSIKVIKQDGWTIEPMPDYKSRCIVYICGPAGSGKTYYASMWIKNFKLLYPDSTVYVFSRLEFDKTLDHLNVVRVKNDMNLVTNPIDIFKDLRFGDLVFFDDCDTVTEKKIRDALSKIQNDVLETGRHNNIHILITSHLITGNDRKNTRTVLNEAQQIVVFPKSGAAHQIRYALKNYVGLTAKQIDMILKKIPSRYVCVGKTYPQYILHEFGCSLL